MPGAMDKAKAWFSEPISKVRIAWENGSGGTSMGLDEARELRDQLDGAIQEAEAELEG